MTKRLGRQITHVKLSPEEKVQKYLDWHLPEHYAKLLTYLETMTAKGMEDRKNDDVERVTGRKATSFDEWLQENKHAWD